MSVALKMREAFDRPGWIPPAILYDWDPDPYAYQTEEELMPAGGPHGKLLGYTVKFLWDFLEKRGVGFLMDTFMLYRDSDGVKQRVAPDLLFMPFREDVPSSYDLDTEPPPLAVAEITSPDSHLKDLKENVSLYTGLGIQEYLVIDSVSSGGKPRRQIGLYLWRKTAGGFRRVPPDSEGYLSVPQMRVKIRAVGRKLIFADIVTGEILYDMGQQRQQTEKERQRAEAAELTAEKERRRAETAELTAEKERQQAEQAIEKERQRAETAEMTAEKERQRAEELAEKLRALGIDPG